MCAKGMGDETMRLITVKKIFHYEDTVFKKWVEKEPLETGKIWHRNSRIILRRVLVGIYEAAAEQTVERINETYIGRG